jgi:hypothetical protein
MRLLNDERRLKVSTLKKCPGGDRALFKNQTTQPQDYYDDPPPSD